MFFVISSHDLSFFSLVTVNCSNVIILVILVVKLIGFVLELLLRIVDLVSSVELVIVHVAVLPHIHLS